MADEIKFSDEEMSGIKDIQSEYLSIQQKFGQLSIAKLNLEDKQTEVETLETELSGEFQNLKQKEKELVEKLSEKYGQGNLDPATGVFNPITEK